MSKTGSVCYIGIGANLGDAAATVSLAAERIGALPDTALLACSNLFRSAPIDAGGDDYVNAVARIETTLGPQLLLRELQALENAFGRERPYRHAPRTLDLDLLLYGQQKIADDTLTVPHPRMHERAFVLIPLLQLDPFITIPGRGPAHQFAPLVANQVIRKI